MAVTPRSQTLGKHARHAASWLFDEAVRRFGSVQGAALEGCARTVSVYEVTSDPRALGTEEDLLESTRIEGLQ